MDFKPSYQQAGGKTRITGKAKVVSQDPAALRAVVVVVSGYQMGETALLETPPLVIGRGSDAGLSLQDQHISKHHVRIDRNGKGEFTLEDMSSRNGTFLGGKRCRGKTVLRGGESFVCGRTAMRFLLEEQIS